MHRRACVVPGRTSLAQILNHHLLAGVLRGDQCGRPQCHDDIRLVCRLCSSKQNPLS